MNERDGHEQQQRIFEIHEKERFLGIPIYRRRRDSLASFACARRATRSHAVAETQWAASVATAPSPQEVVRDALSRDSAVHDLVHALRAARRRANYRRRDVAATFPPG